MSVTAVKSLEEFKTITKKDTYSVFDFWATWCGPCRAISPLFEKLASEYSNVEFYKVDIDDQPEIAQEIGLSAVPTFILFKNGESVAQFSSAVPAGLTALLEKAQ